MLKERKNSRKWKKKQNENLFHFSEEENTFFDHRKKYNGCPKTTVKIGHTRLWRYLAENSRHGHVAH